MENTESGPIFIPHSELRIPHLISVALFEPEIPANAGNIARLCAATGTPLHLIGRLGFSFTHPAARRAGMDYWEHVVVHRHLNHEELRQSVPDGRVWMLSTRAERSLWDADFRAGDVLLFGPESRGLPTELLNAYPAHSLRIPMLPDARSLNLATAVGIALFEALRQLAWSPPAR